MSDVLYEKRNHTGILTFNRPSSLNALCESFMKEIRDALEKAEKDPELRALILTGCGKSFIAGADIKEMYAKDADSIFAWSALGSELNMKIETMKLPVIAAINGYALGGGLELALACDIRIDSENAKMGLPETSLGVICGAGGTQRLPRVIGESAAKELIYTARRIDAQEALRLGLVSRVVSAESLMEEALRLAESIGKNAPIAVRSAKEAIRFGRDASIEEGCLFEREAFRVLFETEDQKTGMGAFIRKEKNVVFRNK